MRIIVHLCLWLLWFKLAVAQTLAPKVEPLDLEALFRTEGVRGAFAIRKLGGSTLAYNLDTCQRRFSPASTFKIPNSMIGLQTGAIPDTSFLFVWDSLPRRLKVWEQNMTLPTAFRVSCVPCYQQLARQVGQDSMAHWVHRLNYGNMDISGGLDRFWLHNTLKISPLEQLDFLEKLWTGQLGFGPQHLAKLKAMMLMETKGKTKLYGKTGTDMSTNAFTGWLVGYVTQGPDVYVYACLIFGPGKDTDRLFAVRMRLARQILAKMGLW